MNSPARKKTKKPTHAAAHNMILSGTWGAESQMSFSLWRTSVVMGSRFLAGVPDRESPLLIPVSTYSRRGHPLANGLPSDFCIWRHRIPARYVLIVVCLRPSPARNATYRHRVSSTSGYGLHTWYFTQNAA